MTSIHMAYPTEKSHYGTTFSGTEVIDKNQPRRSRVQEST